MGNKTLGIARKTVAKPNEFCSWLLQNWNLNTHPYLGTFRAQGMKPPDVLL